MDVGDPGGREAVNPGALCVLGWVSDRSDVVLFHDGRDSSVTRDRGGGEQRRMNRYVLHGGHHIGWRAMCSSYVGGEEGWST